MGDSYGPCGQPGARGTALVTPALKCSTNYFTCLKQKQHSCSYRPSSLLVVSLWWHFVFLKFWFLYHNTIEMKGIQFYPSKAVTSKIILSSTSLVDHRVFEAMTVRSGSWVEPIDSGLNRSSLREVEALAVQLCGLTLPSSQENQEQSDSLMQHIQVQHKCMIMCQSTNS